MSKKRYIDTKFWDDNYIINKDPIEKLLFLYLLTNTLTNIVGIYEISLRRIAFDTGIDSEMVDKILKRFEADDKIKYVNGWIAIKNFIKNQLSNPSVNKGIEMLLKEVPDYLVEWVNIDWDRLSGSVTNLILLNTNTNTNLNLIADSKGDDFKKTWKDFIEMRVKIRKPMTVRAGELLIMDLNQLSNDENIQIAILNQSIKNSWQGVFPLKNKDTPKKMMGIDEALKIVNGKEVK